MPYLPDSGSAPELVKFITNVRDLLPNIWTFITAFCFLTGMTFAFKAVFTFKEYGEMRVMMSTHTDIRKPLVPLLVSIIFLYAPTVAEYMTYTVFKTGISPLDYAAEDKTFTDMIKIMGRIVQIVGFIAFIRGWMLLTRIAQQGGQAGIFPKALTHILGGLFALNIFATWRILYSLFK